MDPTLIKYLPDGKKVLLFIIAPGIKEGGFSDACTFVAQHYSNGSSHIQGINFDQSYIPIAYYDSFSINIYIAAMHILTARVLDVSVRVSKSVFQKQYSIDKISNDIP